MVAAPLSTGGSAVADSDEVARRYLPLPVEFVLTLGQPLDKALSGRLRILGIDPLLPLPARSSSRRRAARMSQ